MSPQINLASEPFRRDRLVLVTSAAIAGVLLVTLALLVSIIVTDRRAMQNDRMALERLDLQMRVMRTEQSKLDAQLRMADNADVLDRSVFINRLLYRKGISWTRLFEDLGKVAPPNVRIVSIRPQVDERDHIALDMTVGAESQQPIIEFITKLESSDLFGDATVSVIQPPSQTDPLYRYRIGVNYAQKL
jgi:Tfp pilus assembly protein PilN